MGKFGKKIVSLVLLSTLAVAGVVAANPHQAAAAVSAESLVVKAEKDKPILLHSISVGYSADAKKQPYKEYNQAKKDYSAAKAAVAKETKKNRNRLNPRLDAVKLWIDRTATYIDAINSGKKLATLKSTLDTDMAKANLAGMDSVYNNLSYEIKKQAKILYKVYGTTTRQKILDTYKKPAEASKQKALYPVSVYEAINKMVVALQNGDEATANRYANYIGQWYDQISNETLLNALDNYAIDQLTPYWNAQNEDINKIAQDPNYSFNTGDPNINAFDGFLFYNSNNDLIYPLDPNGDGYIIKDDKGYFNEDGSLADAYTQGLTDTGTVHVKVIDSTTGDVAAEGDFNIVVGPKYYSLDQGKIVDANNSDATTLKVGQTYQFVPTEATNMNFDPVKTSLNLADFTGITFTSNNTNVFTVDANGAITPVAAGSAKLLVNYNDMPPYTLTVTVSAQ